MSQSTPVLLYDDLLNQYTFGPSHPMAPNRLRFTLDLIRHFGIDAHLRVEPPAPEADELAAELIPRLHSPEYLTALHSGEPAPDFGLGTNDHPVQLGLAAAAAHVVAGTIDAARRVWTGDTPRALNLAGGLHHAQPSMLSGFCALNDAAAAITWLLAHGAERVAYLDLDAHHGDGVEAMFWDDPRVLTISVHESGIYLFPYTGNPCDIGGEAALGTAVNVALAPETGDEEWLAAIHGVVPQVLGAFRPEILISQHGTDPHTHDPLTHLNVSTDAEAAASQSVAAWADQFAGGKWVALGGGGYDLDAVARIWAGVAAAAAGTAIDADAAMPKDWAAHVGAGRTCAPTYGDAEEVGDTQCHHPTRHAVTAPSAAVIATSRAVFPYWGLAPYG